MPPRPRLQQPLLADDPIVIAMRPYPPPQNPVVCVNAERSIMDADAHRVMAPNTFEVKRGMSGVGLEQLELLVRQLAYGGRQCIVQPPE